MKTREEDFVAQLIIDSTHAYLLCFTNSGRVYWLKVYEIPDVGAAGKGKAMASLVDLQPGEKVVTILPVRDLTEDSSYVLFATRNGTVKKTALKDFSNVMARGIIAIGIDKDDELITARLTDGEQVIFLATHDGMAIRFDERDLRSMGRPAFGNRGISLKKGDFVIGAAVTPSPEARNKQRLAMAAAKGLKDQVEAVLDETTTSTATQPMELAGDPTELAAPALSEEAVAKLEKLDKELGLTPCLILTVSENGFGKRTDVDMYRLQSRGGKGVINMQHHPQNRQSHRHPARRRHHRNDGHQPVRQNHPHRHQQVRAAGRATMGVKLLDLDTDDKVAAAMVIPPDEGPKTNGEGGTLLQ